MNTYAAYYEDEVRSASSSGGIFTALCSGFDVVYGVAMADDCRSAVYRRVEGDPLSLRGAKYLQASVGDTFRRVKEDLESGHKVLFSGTGCQVNGLKCYLMKEYPGLVCVDILCHGVPSRKLWDKYVQKQEETYGKLERVNFRCKDRGWQGYGLKLNDRYVPKDTDPYMQLFLGDCGLRPSCYSCHAKSFKQADITIGDFWGIDRVAPEMNDKGGTSLVIVRTEKGQNLFDEIKGSLRYKEVSYEEGVSGNPVEYRSTDRPAGRDTFYRDLEEISLEQMEKKYAQRVIKKKPLYKKVGGRIKRLLPGLRRGK